VDPTPNEEAGLFHRPLPLLNTYITYIPNSTPLFKESLDIPNIPIIYTLTYDT